MGVQGSALLSTDHEVLVGVIFVGHFDTKVYPRRPRHGGPGAQNGAETQSRF